MNIRQKRIGAAVGAALAVVLILWFFVDVTARRASFCDGCHYMKPYVKQWKNSTHSKVECIRCHPTQRRQMLAQLVRYWSGTYSPKPKAFVPDSACTAKGCHTEMTKSKAVSFGSVTFPHQPHLEKDRRGIKLRCASCHGASSEAGHVSVDERVCYLCHFKGQPPAGVLGTCGACHGAPSGNTQHGGFIFDMKAYVDSGVQCTRCHLKVHEGEGGVSGDRCFACHMDRGESKSDTRQVHEKHVTQKEVRCLDCHEPIRHGNIKVLSVLDVSCESCHSNLHTGAKEMYLGVGAKGVPSTPSRMFAAQINCTGCHTQVTTQGGLSFLGQGSKTADVKACAACHDARYVPMVAVWKEQGAALAGESRQQAAEAKALASRLGDAASKQVADELAFNAEFIQQGHPVHNIEYAIRIVRYGAEAVAKLSGKGSSPTVRTPFAKGDFTFCGPACHNFIPKADPIDFKGVDFPHGKHSGPLGLSCDTCHVAQKHKEITLGSPSDCASCHHDSAKSDCSKCHQRQSALFRGKIPPSIGINAAPDSMAEAVGCSDCHDPAKGGPGQQVEKACVSCHEGQGSKDLASWRASIKDAFDKVRLLEQEAEMALRAAERGGVSLQAQRRKLKSAQDRLTWLERATPLHNFNASSAEIGRIQKEMQSLLTEISAPKNK